MQERSNAIVVRHEGGISTITFNRPERLNALDPSALLEFMDVLLEVDLEPSTRAIVVTGAGRAFTAGGDITSFGSAPDHRVNRRGWYLVYRMLEVEKPMVAMVNGPAMGLGLTIALLCDSIIAAEDAVMGDPHVELGAVAGDGVAVVLPLIVGPHRAKELLMTGKKVTGTEAASMGMVNRAVPRAQLEEAAYGLANELASQPVYAVRATKMMVNRYVRWMAGQLLDVALAYEEISRGLPEYRDAVEKWKSKQSGSKAGPGSKGPT
jgi:enoyl-CoA hydratase/carnithine racemase